MGQLCFTHGLINLAVMGAKSREGARSVLAFGIFPETLLGSLKIVSSISLSLCSLSPFWGRTISIWTRIPQQRSAVLSLLEAPPLMQEGILVLTLKVGRPYGTRFWRFPGAPSWLP